MVTLNASENLLIKYLREKQVNLSTAEAKDFGLHGHETEAQIREAANDFISELRSEKAACQAFKHCPQSVNPIDY